jgi:hypothetical protein
MTTTSSSGYSNLPTPAQIQQTISELKPRGINVQLVDTPADALDKLQQLIPSGATLMIAASQSLKEIGFEDLLKAKTHGWVNLKEALFSEPDSAKQAELRTQSALADYYVGSVQAITEAGEMMIASHSGSQLPAYAFTSRNVIWVAGVQKIVPTLEAALRRIREYSLPREDERMKAMGMRGSRIGKLLIFEWEAPHLQRHLNLILVNQVVGV